MSRGFIYVLSNPSMPDMVKIGKTTRHPEQRAHELHTTGVPTPFHAEFWQSVPDCDEAERLIHERLEGFRVSSGREFFKVPAGIAVAQINEIAYDQIRDLVLSFTDELSVLPQWYGTFAGCIERRAVQYGVESADLASTSLSLNEEQAKAIINKAHLKLAKEDTSPAASQELKLVVANES